MPNGLPYNENLVQRRTEEIMRGGPNIASERDLLRPTIVHDPDFEFYPSGLEEAEAAIHGLSRIFTVEGRRERASERAEILQKRIEVAEYLGETILNPDKGWAGTHKQASGVRIHREEDEANLGFQLLDKANLDFTVTPNENRPVTLGERFINWRLENKIVKSRKLREHSRWMDTSYREGLQRDRYRLSRTERKLMHDTSHHIEEHDEKAKKQEEKFANISNSRDAYGKYTQWRLNRALSFPDRQDRRLYRGGRAITRVADVGIIAAEHGRATARKTVEHTKAAVRKTADYGKRGRDYSSLAARTYAWGVENAARDVGQKGKARVHNVGEKSKARVRDISQKGRARVRAKIPTRKAPKPSPPPT